MRPVTKFETLSRDQLAMIRRSMTPISAMVCSLGDADISRGAGVIDPGTKCIWTKDGRRIELSYAAGTFIASVSKEPDPAAPSKAKP